MSAVDEYLANVPPTQRAELERIRSLIKQTVPEAEEVITYSMPGFKYKGKYLVAYAAFKDHMSLFPGAEPIGKLHQTLGGHITGKGTIQFTLEDPLPDMVIAEIIQTSQQRIES